MITSNDIKNFSIMIKQMKHDIDRAEIRCDDLTTDKPYNVFYCNTEFSENEYQSFNDLYYKYENEIHTQLEKYILLKFLK